MILFAALVLVCLANVGTLYLIRRLESSQRSDSWAQTADRIEHRQDMKEIRQRLLTIEQRLNKPGRRRRRRRVSPETDKHARENFLKGDRLAP